VSGSDSRRSWQSFALTGAAIGAAREKLYVILQEKFSDRPQIFLKVFALNPPALVPI
jgi:hypothetical protein